MAKTITCPECGMTSKHPTDIRDGYCGACHDWTSKPAPLPPPRGGAPHLLECAYAPTQNGVSCSTVCWRPGQACPYRVPLDRSPETVEAWLREGAEPPEPVEPRGPSTR